MHPPYEKTVNLILTDFGLKPASFRQANLTMESDRFICVKDTTDDGLSQVVVIDTQNENDITKKPMKAEGALMNPLRYIMALKGFNEGHHSHCVQVFDLTAKTKICSFSFKGLIAFWKWLSQDELVVICGVDVFHWNIRNGEPFKIFQRCGKVSEPTAQIISYATTSDRKWCVVCAIYMREEGFIDGAMQLYSAEKNQQQMLTGHAGCFGLIRVTDKLDMLNVFAFLERKEQASTAEGDTNSKLNVMALSRTSGFKLGVPVSIPRTSSGVDFPLLMTLTAFGVLVAATKGGYLLAFDVILGSTLFVNQISEQSIFSVCPLINRDGIRCVNRIGEVITSKLNPMGLISSLNISNPDNSRNISISLVRRHNFPLDESQLLPLFNWLFDEGDFKGAAEIIASDIRCSLRTPTILHRFRTAPARPGGGSPLLQYFSALLETKNLMLNKAETLLLIAPVVQQGRRDLIDKWISEDRLFCCEEAADLISKLDSSGDENTAGSLGMKVYEKILMEKGSVSPAVFNKVVSHMVNLKRFSEIPSYLHKVNAVDHQSLNVGSILLAALDSDKSTGIVFCNTLVSEGFLSADAVVETMLGANKNDLAAAFLLESIRNCSDDISVASRQPKLLDITMNCNPEKGEELLRSGRFRHYNRAKIATICEKLELWESAVEQFIDFETNVLSISELTRIIRTSESFSVNYIEDLMQRLIQARHSKIEDTVFCATGQEPIMSGMKTDEITWTALVHILKELLQKECSVQKCVARICTKYHDEKMDSSVSGRCSSTLLEEMMPSLEKNPELLFTVLGGVLPLLNEPNLIPLTHKYINTALSLSRDDEVERLVRLRTGYDPLCVQRYLIDCYESVRKNRKDSGVLLKSLIHLCDIHGFIETLVDFLYRNELVDFLEIYTQKVSPAKIPEVVSRLIDRNVKTEDIMRILPIPSASSPLSFSVSELVSNVSKKGKLIILKPFIETLIKLGSKEEAVHTSMAKISVLTGNGKDFLQTNMFYDRKEIGKFCETRDVNLAFLAYSKGDGICDGDLIRICVQGCLYRNIARYLVKRKDLCLWKCYLVERARDIGNGEFVPIGLITDEARDAIFEELLNVALPESSCNDSVLCAVKAFAAANTPHKLIQLLEKVIFDAPQKDHPLSEKTYQDLENLLLLTAIKSTPEKVMDYIDKLSHYDSNQIAKIALAASLKEEAFEIYKKAKMAAKAMETLLTIYSEVISTESDKWTRAREFAVAVDQPHAWSILGNSLLIASQGADNNSHEMASEAIDCYIKGSDVSEFEDVIEVGMREECHRELIPYLQMARNYENNAVDSNTIYQSQRPELVLDLQLVDTELAYCLAQVGLEKQKYLDGGKSEENIEHGEEWNDLKTFISSVHGANLKNVGDRLFEEKLFSVAIIVYQQAKLYQLMATCYLHIGKYRSALQCAAIADQTETWKDVCFAALTAGETDISKAAGIPILNSVEYFPLILEKYNEEGEFQKLTELLETAIFSEEDSTRGSHQGVFTELGILYALHFPDKLSGFIQSFGDRLSVPKLVKACEDRRHWRDAVTLHILYDEPEKAIRLMVENWEDAYSMPALSDAVFGCFTMHRRMTRELLHFCVDSLIARNEAILDDMLCGVLSRYIKTNVTKKPTDMRHPNRDTAEESTIEYDPSFDMITKENIVAYIAYIGRADITLVGVLKTLSVQEFLDHMKKSVKSPALLLRRYLEMLQITIHALISRDIPKSRGESGLSFELSDLLTDINDMCISVLVDDILSSTTEVKQENGLATPCDALMSLIYSIERSMRMSFALRDLKVEAKIPYSGLNVSFSPELNIIFSYFVPILSESGKRRETVCLSPEICPTENNSPNVNDKSIFNVNDLISKFENSPIFGLKVLNIVLHSYTGDLTKAIQICLAESMFEEAIILGCISRNQLSVRYIINYFLSYVSPKSENTDQIPSNLKNQGGPDFTEGTSKLDTMGGLYWFEKTMLICEDLIEPQEVLSLVWSKGCIDSAIPYFVRIISRLYKRVDDLETRLSRYEGAPAGETVHSRCRAGEIDTIGTFGHKSVKLSRNNTDTKTECSLVTDTVRNLGSAEGVDWTPSDFDVSALGSF